MKKNYLILLFFCVFILFIGLWIGAFLLCFYHLVPSINEAKLYKSIKCNITASYVYPICDSSRSCIKYNNDIWWYEEWGSKQFYDKMTGGSLPSDDEYQPQEDPRNASDLKFKKKNNNFTTINAKYIKILSFLEENSNSNSSSSSNSTSTSDINSNSMACPNDSYNCYHGIQNVTFIEPSTGNIGNSVIMGLWANDLNWVNQYVDKFSVGTVTTCFSNSNSPDKTILFKPPKYKSQYLAGVILLFLFGFFALLLSIFFLLKDTKYFVNCCRSRRNQYREKKEKQDSIEMCEN